MELRISSVCAFDIAYGAASRPFFLSFTGFPEVDTKTALA